MAKLTSKFVRVSPTLSAKALEDGKIKNANATVAGKSYSNVIKSLNGLGAAFTSQASLISSYAKSLQKTVEATDTLKQNLKDLSEARSTTADAVSGKDKPSKPSTSDTNKKPSPMDKAMKKDIKEKSNGFFGKIGGLFGFLKGFITKFFVFAIAQSVLKWIADPANAKKVKNIVKGLKSTFGFLFKVVTGVGELVAGGIVNLGSGLQKIFGSGGDPKKILSGFGDLLQAIPGIFVAAWILNPAGMFKAVIRILTSWKEPKEKEPEGPDKKKDKKPEKPEKPEDKKNKKGDGPDSKKKGPKADAPDAKTKKPGFFDQLQERAKKFGKNVDEGIGAIGKFARRQGQRAIDFGDNIVKGFRKTVEFLGENWKKLSKGTQDAMEKLQKYGAGLVKKGQASLLDWLSKQGGILGKVGKYLPDLMKKLGKYLPFVGDVVGFVFDVMNGIDWRRALIRALVGVGIDAGFTALMAALGLATPFTGGASGIAATALYIAYMGADLAVGGLGVLIGDPIADALGIPMKAGEKSENAKIGNIPNDEKAKKESIDAIQKKDPDYAKKIAEKEAKKKGNSAEDGGILGPDGKEKPKNLGSITNKNSDYWIDLLGTGGVGLTKGGKNTLRGLFGQAIYWTKIFADATLELKKKGIFQKGLEGIMNVAKSIGDKLDSAGQALSTFAGNVLAKLGIGTGEYGEAPLKKAAEAAGIKGKELAAFLAQMSHETGQFNYKEEIGGGKDSYDGGKKYKGRGYIQLTHKYNYAFYGKEFGVDLVGNPDLAKDGELAAKIAVSYWMRNVRPTVRGDWDNVFLHSKAINYPAATRKSQVNGMADREKKYAAYIKKLGLDKKADGGILRRESLPSVRVGFSFAKTVKDKEKPKLFAGGGSLPAGAHRLVPNDPSSSWAAGIPLTRVSAASGQKAEVALPLAKRFQGFIKELEGTGYKIDQLGGWRLDGPPGGNKDGKGPQYAHPYGAAIDINWNRNPAFKKAGNDFPAGVKAMAAKYGLGWGNAFDDAMHFSAMKREYGAGIDGQEISKKSLMGSKGGDGFTPSDTGTAGDAPPATGVQETQTQEAELTPEQALAAAVEKLISATSETKAAFSGMSSQSAPTVPAKAPERAAGGEVKSPIHTFKEHGSALHVGRHKSFADHLAAVANKSEAMKKKEAAGMAAWAKAHPKAAAKLNPPTQNVEVKPQLQLNVKTDVIMKDSHVVTEQPSQVKTMILNNTVRSSQQIVTGNNAYPVYSSPKTTNFFC